MPGNGITVGNFTAVNVGHCMVKLQDVYLSQGTLAQVAAAIRPELARQQE